MSLLPPSTQLTWELSASGGSATVKTDPVGGLVSQLTSDRRAVPLGAVELPDTPNIPGQTTWSPLTGAAFVDGIFAGLPVVEAVSHIDPAFLAAVQESTAQHIHGMLSVHSYVAQHFFKVPTETADGWFERLTGYVMEQKAASALESAGHHVTFAATANQPVWDLIVDGHPVQIKEGISGVKAYLLEHHGVPIYTGDDVAAAFKDPLVHGLSGLSSSHIHEITQHSIDGVSDAFDVGFHIPFITLAFSSFRELKLLLGEKTTVQRATLNVGLDVAGVGTGASLGAKLGAVAGSVFPGPGTMVGALLGGVLGGIGGRMMSTNVRQSAFRAAVAGYGECTDLAKEEIDAAIWKSNNQIVRLQEELERRYETERSTVEQTANTQFRIIRIAFENEFVTFAESFPTFLRELRLQLRSEENTVVTNLAHPSWRAWLLPTKTDHIRYVTQAWFKKADDIIVAELRDFDTLQPRSPGVLHGKIKRFVTAYSFQLSSLDEAFSAITGAYLRAQETSQRVQNDAVHEITKRRELMIRHFSEQTVRLHDGIADLLKGWNEKITSKREKLKREGQAVGVEI